MSHKVDTVRDVGLNPDVRVVSQRHIVDHRGQGSRRERSSRGRDKLDGALDGHALRRQKRTLIQANGCSGVAISLVHHERHVRNGGVGVHKRRRRDDDRGGSDRGWEAGLLVEQTRERVRRHEGLVRELSEHRRRAVYANRA